MNWKRLGAFLLLVGILFWGQELNSAPIEESALDWQGWVTVALFIVTMGALVFELLPADVTMLLAGLVMVMLGILSPKEFLAGFSKDIIFTVAMLFVVAAAVDRCGILGMVGSKLLPPERGFRTVLPLVMVSTMGASSVLSNTTLVLMMTPFIRTWTFMNKSVPSKFLIPLSYSAILGGLCTLIGTSSNLVVDGLLRNQAQVPGFTFFELTWIGVPCALVGLFYINTIGHRLLPWREDPSQTYIAEAREFTSEWLVKDHCPLVGLTVEDAAGQYFGNESLLQIERDGRLIDAPAATERVEAQDRLVFAGGIKDIVQLHTISGLRSLADPHFKIDPVSTHFTEVVVAFGSPVVGKTLKELDFRKAYGASVVAILREGRRVEGVLNRIALSAGDTLVLISSRQWNKESYTREFYTIHTHEKIELYPFWKIALIFGILLGMIALALFGVPMLKAASLAAILMMLIKSLSIPEARKAIHWHLLILIASSFAFGQALIKTGAASYLAKTILPLVGGDPYWLIGGIFLTSMLVTEVITNNAAALLVFPIAIQTARLAGFDDPASFHAVGITVAVAVSCSFSTPIGYQANTIVYGPGGYRFADYIRVGLPLNLLLWALCTFLIPRMWPLVASS